MPADPSLPPYTLRWQLRLPAYMMGSLHAWLLRHRDLAGYNSFLEKQSPLLLLHTHLHWWLLVPQDAQQLRYILAETLVKHGVRLVNDKPANARQAGNTI
jgi:hypothetical protein